MQSIIAKQVVAWLQKRAEQQGINACTYVYSVVWPCLPQDAAEIGEADQPEALLK